MSKYKDLDAAILQAIHNGINTSMKMEYNEALKQATSQFVVERKTPHFRVIDGRLQALRKAGKIAFVAQKWHVLGASQ